VLIDYILTYKNLYIFIQCEGTHMIIVA